MQPASWPAGHAARRVPLTGQVMIQLDDQALLAFLAASGSLPEVVGHLAGPPEHGPGGFGTVRRRAWEAICRCEAAGVVERAQSSPLETPRWRAVR